jgi:hypothetical protein
MRYWAEANWGMVLAGGWGQEGMEGMVALALMILGVSLYWTLMQWTSHRVASRQPIAVGPSWLAQGDHQAGQDQRNLPDCRKSNSPRWGLVADS